MWERLKQGYQNKAYIAVVVVGLAMAFYHLVYTQIFLWSNVAHINAHLGFCLLMVFLDLFAKSKGRFRMVWLLTMALLALVATGYVQIFWKDLQQNAYFNTTFELTIGVIIIFLVMEATRRDFGLFLPILSLVIVLYPFIGQHLPEPFRCTAFSIDQTISNLSIGLSNGIYGVVLPTSANYIFLFVLFGALLQGLGGSKFFMLVAKMIVGKVQGGPGLMAVMSSAIIGSITGSASANIAIMGSFNIPFMKMHGFKKEYAAAIEAAASNGGSIMPPVMGICAFGMAGITGIPYLKIIVMAIIPALLYYFALGLYVYFRAGQLRIAKLPPEKVSAKELIASAPSFVIPFIVILALLMAGYTVMYTAFWTIVATVVIAFLRKDRPTIDALIKGMVNGARMGAGIGVSAACVGPILATFTMTGLAVKISSGIQQWSGGYMFLGLLIIFAIIVAMGCLGASLTAYLVTSIFGVPALMKMGVGFAQAHFFTMFVSTFAFLTPPVALAALIAAKLAEADYLKTASEAVKTALGGFTIPFLFVYAPFLLLLPQEPVSAATGLMASILYLFAAEVALIGYYMVKCNIPERLLIAAGSISFFLSVVLSNLSLFVVGLVLVAAITFSQWRKRSLGVTAEVSTFVE